MKILFTDYLTEDAKRIRQEVFVEEQGFNNEFDHIDSQAKHLVLYENNMAIGCCRLFPGDTPNSYVLGRLAIRKDFRGQKLGRKIIKEAEKHLQLLHAKKLSLSAQSRVRKFYEKLGYTASGKEYLDESCPHIHMEKFFNK